MYRSLQAIRRIEPIEKQYKPHSKVIRTNLFEKNVAWEKQNH